MTSLPKAVAPILVGLALIQFSCASVLDRAQQAWDRGEPDRAAELLDRSQVGIAQEAWPMEAVLLRLELDLNEAPDDAPVDPAIERLATASDQERGTLAADRLGTLLLETAEHRQDRSSWVRTVLALSACDGRALDWLAGLLALLEEDHQCGAKPLSGHLERLAPEERQQAMTTIDLWLYQLRPMRSWSSFRALVLTLGQSDGPDELGPVLLRHELFGVLERNREPRASLLAEVRAATGQTTAQLAAEASLRGLHRTARALWVEVARDSPPETAIQALRQAAESAYLQNDLRGARRLLDESVLHAPRSLDPLLAAVRTAVSRGDRAFAELLLDRATVGAPCDVLVTLALPRLRLQVGRADDESALAELERTAERCSAPALLDGGAAYFAEHAAPAAALALLESRLDVGSRDPEVLRAWVRLAPVGEPAAVRLRRILGAMPSAEALTLAEDLDSEQPALVGPVLLELSEARWRQAPADGAAMRSLLERLWTTNDEDGPPLSGIIETHLAAHPEPADLVETVELLVTGDLIALEKLAAARAILDHLESRPPLSEPGSTRLLTADVVVSALEGEVARSVDLLEQRSAGEDPVRLGIALLSGLTAAERVALLDAGAVVDAGDHPSEVVLAESLLEDGRFERAMTLWQSLAERSPDVVIATMVELSSTDPSVAARLGAMLQGSEDFSTTYGEERLVLFLQEASISDGLARIEWLARARRDALDLLEDGGTLRRDTIGLLRALGQPDLSSLALRNEMLGSSRTRRSTVIQWVEDRLAVGDDEQDLQRIVHEALVGASSIERADAAQRLGAAGAVSLARDLREAELSPSEARDPSPLLVEREVTFLVSQGATDLAEELVGAMLLEPALALTSPHPFDDPPGPSEAARAVRWASDAAQRYGELGRTSRAVHAWAIVLRYGPPEQKVENLVHAIGSLTQPARSPLTAALLEQLVGAAGGSPSSWTEASRELEAAGEVELALHATLRASALLKRDHGLRQRAARLHTALGQHEQAIVAWEHAIDLAPAEHLVSVLVDLHAHFDRPIEEHGAFPAFFERARSSGDEALAAIASQLGGDRATLPPGDSPFVLLLRLDRHSEAFAGWLLAVPTLNNREATALLRTWGRHLREAVDEDQWIELLEAHLAAGVASQTAERHLALALAGRGELQAAADRIGEADGTAETARAGWLLRAGTTITQEERTALLLKGDLHLVTPALLFAGELDAFETSLLEAARLPGASEDLRRTVLRVALARTPTDELSSTLHALVAELGGAPEEELRSMMSSALAIHGVPAAEALMTGLPSGLPGPTERERVDLAIRARATGDLDLLEAESHAHRHSAGQLLEVELELAEVLLNAGLLEEALGVLEDAWPVHGPHSGHRLLELSLPVAHALGSGHEQTWATRALALPVDHRLLAVVDTLLLIGRTTDAEVLLERLSPLAPASTALLARRLVLAEILGQPVTPRMQREARWLVAAEGYPPALRSRLERVAGAFPADSGGEGLWQDCLRQAGQGDPLEAARRCALLPPPEGGVFDGVAPVLDAMSAGEDPARAATVAREAFPAAFAYPGMSGDAVRAPWLLLEAGQLDEARIVAARAILLDPDSWRAHAAYAGALSAAGDDGLARWHAYRSARLGGLPQTR